MLSSRALAPSRFWLLTRMCSAVRPAYFPLLSHIASLGQFSASSFMTSVLQRLIAASWRKLLSPTLYFFKRLSVLLLPRTFLSLSSVLSLTCSCEILLNSLSTSCFGDKSDSSCSCSCRDLDFMDCLSDWLVALPVSCSILNGYLCLSLSLALWAYLSFARSHNICTPICPFQSVCLPHLLSLYLCPSLLFHPSIHMYVFFSLSACPLCLCLSVCPGSCMLFCLYVFMCSGLLFPHSLCFP